MPRLDKESEVKKAIAAAVIPAGKRDVLIFDGNYRGAIPGFGVRKFSSGCTSFFLKYQVGGRARRVALGNVVFTQTKDGQEIRGNLQRMREWAGKVKDSARVLGRDEFAERKAEEAARKAAEREIEDAPTLQKLAPSYLRDRERGKTSKGREIKKLKARSLIETRRYLEGSTRTPSVWKPIANVPLARLTMRQLQEIVEHTARSRGSVTADRARVALSGLFAWAVEEKIVDANPTNDLPAQSLNAARERTLTEPELVEIWRACGDDEHGKIVKLLMLTGCRRAEIGDLSWEEVDLERRRIDLPAHRCKNNRPHAIPLAAQAAAIIKSIPRDNVRNLLFGYGSGGYGGWSKSKAELDERVARARGKAGRGDMDPWVLHDIRRSVVTHLLESRERRAQRGKLEAYSFAQPHVTEAIVNHVSGHKGGVAGVYNKAAYYAEKREALQRWADHLSKVVALRPRQRVSCGNKRKSARAAAGVPAA
jgi:integrase